MSIFGIALLILTSLSTPLKAQTGICSWKNLQVKASQNSSAEIYTIFEVKNDHVLWTLNAPQSARIAQFKQVYGKYLKGQQRFLMERQMAFFLKSFGANAPEYRIQKAIYEGQVGQITQSRCFDLLLLDEHLKFNKLPSQTEFGAYVFSKTVREDTYLRVIFQSTNVVGVPGTKRLETDIKASQQSGWQMVAHIHLHPFLIEQFNNGQDAAGTIWPSGNGQIDYADIGTYQRRLLTAGLQQAWITNGFDTFYLKSPEFEKLRIIGSGYRF